VALQLSPGYRAAAQVPLQTNPAPQSEFVWQDPPAWAGALQAPPVHTSPSWQSESPAQVLPMDAGRMQVPSLATAL
jgi:hypothetical protein